MTSRSWWKRRIKQLSLTCVLERELKQKGESLGWKTDYVCCFTRWCSYGLQKCSFAGKHFEEKNHDFLSVEAVRDNFQQQFSFFWAHAPFLHCSHQWEEENWKKNQTFLIAGVEESKHLQFQGVLLTDYPFVENIRCLIFFSFMKQTCGWGLFWLNCSIN